MKRVSKKIKSKNQLKSPKQTFDISFDSVDEYSDKKSKHLKKKKHTI